MFDSKKKKKVFAYTNYLKYYCATIYLNIDISRIVLRVYLTFGDSILGFRHSLFVFFVVEFANQDKTLSSYYDVKISKI